MTLDEFNSKVESNLYVLQIVLSANKNKLLEGNWKDSRKQKCLSERTLALSSAKEI